MPVFLSLPPPDPLPSTPQSGEHLSTWLLLQPDLEHRYTPGLMWEVPSEIEPQRVLRQRLLHRLWAEGSAGLADADRERLESFLQSLPITGRVPVVQSDPRWLQVHPDKNPILAPDQRVILPPRPETLTILLGNGRRCVLRHQPGAETPAYLEACADPLAPQVDEVWIIQPDGHVSHAGVAQWNATAQEQPAPGAWIWAPGRRQPWPAGYSEDLARFLATQGPSGPEAASTPARDTAIQAESPRRDPVTTTDDFGRTGLLQTPTARMAPSGNLNFTYDHVAPYDRANFFLQPLDWFEFGFRYTNIENRAYGSTALSGSQNYKDKSVDFKARLLEEGRYQPALALGITDIGGTGLFSSEYLVSNKRLGDFDWSLGIGWGYMANSANIRNPFTLLAPSFATRQTKVGYGGNFNTGSFFHGNSALFGGVQYQTPWDPLILKLEYDPNNYQNEPLGNVLPQRSPINIGAVYRYSPHVDLSAGFERGNTAMVGLTLHDNLAELSMPKILDQPLPRVTDHFPTMAPQWSHTVQDIQIQTQWVVRSLTQNGDVIDIRLDQAHGIYFAERLERATAILHRDAPANIKRFVFTVYEGGLLQTEWVVLRDEWVAQHTHYQAPSQLQATTLPTDPVNDLDSGDAEPLWTGRPDPLVLGLTPSFTQTVGGPNNFMLYQLGIAAPARLTLNDNTWVDGLANWRMIDNYSLFSYDAPSSLPHVRTDMRQYLTTARLTLPNLQVNHTMRLSDNQFGLAYAGYLESMFAGVGGEWLYRPWDRHLAFGVDINRVQQRGFAQDFSLLPYQVTTGHATAYWDTGWHQTHIDLSAGQYLAGDKGVTIEVSRRFTNGVSMGAYATKTNVSAAQFGEGSFDKGIYVQIPFDAMLPSSSPLMGTFLWEPLIRDGGARLARSTTLYDLTSTRDQRTGEFAPAGSSWWKAMQKLSQNSGPSLWGNIGDSGEWVANDIFSTDSIRPLLTGLALIVPSALLDRTGARWAANHQGGIWKKLGAGANALPYAVGLSAVGMWWGMGNESEAETAQAALLSGGWAYLMTDALKMVTNRKRPVTNQGIDHFGPSFGKGALNSGFPSDTMAVTFAIATPFAQQYNMPWLYGVAGAVAFGRIQGQHHFVSDTVAGSLLGYATGSMLTSWKKSKMMPDVSVGADRTINLNWSY